MWTVINHLWCDESENSQGLGLTVLLLSHAGRDLSRNLDALAFLPAQHLHLTHPKGVFWTLEFHLYHMMVSTREFTCHPAHVTRVKVNLGWNQSSSFNQVSMFLYFIYSVFNSICLKLPGYRPVWFCRGLLLLFHKGMSLMWLCSGEREQNVT